MDLRRNNLLLTKHSMKRNLPKLLLLFAGLLVGICTAQAKMADHWTPNNGDSYAQGQKVIIPSVIMTFGGNDSAGAKYEITELIPQQPMTEGINALPVDDEGNAYNPEQENLPTKGTYYVFEPTKDGTLTIAYGIEKNKTIYVTENGKKLISEKSENDFTGPRNILVKAKKTYYIFSNETNLKFYGFQFEPSNNTPRNVAKDIATFKFLTNVNGDTLLLNNAVVTFIKGDNVFVEDESGATVFFKTQIQFYAGQKLNGFIMGKNHVANYMPQLLKTDDTNYKTFKVSETITPEPRQITIAEATTEQALARYVKMLDVRAKKDAKGFRILTDGKNSIRIEDHFNIFYELPEVVGSIEGIVGINNEGTFFFWPTSKNIPEGVGLTEAEEKLLVVAKKLAEDREAVAVGLLDDEIEKAEKGYGKGLQAAIDLFNENNANDAKVTYAADKVVMQGVIAEAEALGANETHEAFFAAIADAKAALTNIRLNVAEFKAEIDKLNKAITDLKADLLAEAKDLAKDREAVAVGLLDDEIAKAEAGEYNDLQAAINTFNENNTNDAKAAYAAKKEAIQALIGKAEDILGTRTNQSFEDAIAAAKAAETNIRLNAAGLEAETAKLNDAIDAYYVALLAEAKELAKDREAVAVGLLDDEIAKAETGDVEGLPAAVDLFNENNANDAKATYAADKATMQEAIDEAEELLADNTVPNAKDKLNKAVEAAKAAKANNRLNVGQFKAEIAKLNKAIDSFKAANLMANGKYVLKNVASGLYWGAGNNWGTRASLLDYAEYQTLIKQPDGTYQMETQVSNGGTNYFFGGDYMDGAPANLTITPVTEEIVDFNAALYHNWSEVSGVATDNGSANGGLKLNEEVALGSTIWGNLSGAVPFKDYANITDYDELRIEGTPGAIIRLMCNRVTDEGPIYEIKPAIGEDGKLTVKISDLMYLNGGKPCDFVCLQSIKVPAGWQGGNKAATITSMKLVKAKKDIYYTVANGDNYFGYSTKEEAPYVKSTTILGKGLSADDENALWEIVPANEAALETASETKPVDATFMILNPNFGRNNRNGSAWKMEAGNKNLCGGTNENKCAESWRSTFTLSQEIAVPNGVYALSAQAALTDYAEKWDGADYPVVYANEATAPFNNMEGSDRGSNMNTLSAAFANGNYKVGPIYVEVTNGKLTIGVKGTRTDTWCIWDNFQLKYYGADADIENISFEAEAKELENLRKQATELLSTVEIEAVKTILTTALSETAEVSGKAETLAALEIMKPAVEKGETSVTAKNTLAKMKELIDATNVYTQEAYDQYYGTWLAKYENATITKAEAQALQNPSLTTGWHAQITVDNFLLSAWDTNPDFNNAAYYINSWSVEGDNDGTNFRVPFFEYFHDDGTTLGEKTLTATMNGLEPGEYTVSAWARVRVKDASQTSAYGITIQANDGTAVDVCNGDQTERFFLKEVSATGTVGDDGVLKIMFNVAADNNIHWLSFKNVKFEKAEPVEELDPDLIEIAQNQGKDLDTFTRTDLEEGDKYNTYTAHGDLNIAFKMMNIDVTDCDYVIIKFAEPVAAGWHLAFWSNQDLVDVPAGATEFKYVFAEDPKCGIQNGILPQICMMTFFGGFEAPLTAKVTGIYKHRNPSTKIDGMNNSAADDGAIYNLRGQKVENTQKKGLYIINGKKVMIK